MSMNYFSFLCICFTHPIHFLGGVLNTFFQALPNDFPDSIAMGSIPRSLLILCGHLHSGFSPPLDHVPHVGTSLFYVPRDIQSRGRDRAWYLLSSPYISRNFPDVFPHAPLHSTVRSLILSSVHSSVYSLAVSLKKNRPSFFQSISGILF